jgi:hypothetical protein
MIASPTASRIDRPSLWNLEHDNPRLGRGKEEHS